VTAPTGARGRPSKSMTLEQARAVLNACDRHPLGAYVTLALLVGVRNEELRAVAWDHVDLAGNPEAVPPVPPSIRVWRSVRAGGDTKTRLSRRTIGLPAQCVEILEKHRAQMAAHGHDVEHGLVFCTSTGTPLDSANVRRSFRVLCKEAGLDSSEWTPREMRHSFVSLMSEAGVPLEAIARVVGHSSTKVTELVYRKQLRPVLTEGTSVMEALFELPAADRKESPDEG
jgi:integrase